MKVEQEIWQCLRDSIVLPVTCSIEDWAKENVYLTNPPYSVSGFLDLDRSPYLREPMKALQDDHPAREVVFVKSPRLGGTLLAEAFLLWILKTCPADVWWAIHNESDITKMQIGRLFPFLQANGIRWDTPNTGEKIDNFIKFNVGSLNMVGAYTPRKMKMSSGRFLIADEVSAWTNGILQQFRKRAEDYSSTCKILLASEAGHENHDFHKAWKRTNKNKYGFRCSQCDEPAEWRFTHQFNDGAFGALSWDTNDWTKPKGVWNIDRACETAHYKCTNEQCRHVFRDSDRYQLLKSGLYIETNPTADREFAGFRVNSLANPEVTFKKLSREYLEADYENNRGRHDDIQVFWTQRMSRFWQVGKQFNVSHAMVRDASFATGSFEMVMYADTQRGRGNNGSFHPFCLVQFNDQANEMQLLDYGNLDTWSDVRAKQLEWKVPNKRVLCDARGQLSDETYQAIIQNRPNQLNAADSWIAAMGIGTTKGDKAWNHGLDPNTKQPVELPYSKLVQQPVRYGTGQFIAGAYVPLVKYNDSRIKDVFCLLRDNKHPKWKLVIPQKAKDDKDFIAQINNERKVCKTDAKGYAVWSYHKGSGANDFFDCLKGCCLYGMTMGFL